MAGSANNVKIDPVNVLWQIETAEQVDYTGLVAASMGNSYWIIRSAKDATLYHVWHNLDAGGVDPAPVGSTPIEVAITTGDSATVMATAAAAAVDAIVADFDSSSTGAVVDVVRVPGAVGETTDTEDFDSGVVVTVCNRGKDFDLGLIQGDIELNYSPSNFIIQAQQTGVTPLGALFQGDETIEAATVLLETTTSKLEEIYTTYGGSFAPYDRDWETPVC